MQIATEAAEARSNGLPETEYSNEPTTYRAVADCKNGYKGILAINSHIADEKPQVSVTFTKTKKWAPDTIALLHGYGVLEKPVGIEWWGNTTGTDDMTCEEKSPCTISNQEAEKIAKKLVTDIGLENQLDISTVEKTNNGYGQEFYSISFRRSANGLVATQQILSSQGAYRKGFNEEVLSCQITDDGIVFWSYFNPMKVKKVVNEGVGVLSFDEILEIYKKQSTLTYDNIINVNEGINDGKEQISYSTNTTVNINKIELCLVRVAKKDSELEYYLMPVWAFSGTLTHISEAGLTYPEDVTLMVNCVDGSIVSPSDCW